MADLGSRMVLAIVRAGAGVDENVLPGIHRYAGDLADVQVGRHLEDVLHVEGDVRDVLRGARRLQQHEDERNDKVTCHGTASGGI